MRNKSKPIANATINRYAAALASVLAWAAEEDVTPKGWINPMKKVKQREEKNKIVRWLTPDECERLLGACKASEFDRLRLLVLMALVTGARRGELLGLRWCDINMEAGTAALHVTKNGSERAFGVIAERDRGTGAL